MNYKYLQYWIEAIENIKLLEQLMEKNLYMYQRTQYMLYIEYIINITPNCNCDHIFFVMEFFIDVYKISL